MFGDYGHGSLILFVGTLMILFNDRLQKSSMKDICVFRYLFFMMGFFSCYNGLLYNEWFAIPYPWFKSCYVTDKLPTKAQNMVFPYVDFPYSEYPHGLTEAFDDTYCVYPFGMDPTWFLDAGDILVVQDSMKMKMSVIIGVMHMSMGVVTKGLNLQFMNEQLKFWTEVVTGMIILNGLFGWMDILIFIKWFYPMNPYSINPDMVAQINQAPSIITIMINNFLALGKQPFTTTAGVTSNVYLFNGQRMVSEILVICVFISVPIMLFVKPCSAICCPSFSGMPEYDKDVIEEQKQRDEAEKDANQIDTRTDGARAVDSDMDLYKNLLDQEKEGAHTTDIGELFIHQLIETIEFVLGSVSNTASYLRLWALSLAHSQLALVFLQQIL